MKKTSLLLTFLCCFCAPFLYATPSTQVWNPSTDIQAARSFHLGIDNYFSVANNDNKPYAFGTDVGVTYGLLKNVEVGIDGIQPSADPLFFNAKYGLPEGAVLPAVAVGGFNFGTKTDVTDYNMVYGVLAKTFKPVGRISLGYYDGLNDKLFPDEKGGKANTGFIAAWDRAITDKVWASVDYSSGKSWYGALSLGASYAFAPNTSVIFGYVIYNNDKVVTNNQFTTQLDINF
jgi:hypothetical protein